MSHPAHVEPRDWLVFEHPSEEGKHIRADLTWLLSRWACIFGRGCQGVVEGRAQDGCCSHGAFFSGSADRKRVVAMAEELTPEDWQHHGTKKVVETDVLDDKPAKRTKTINGHCVFLNDESFSAGAGCALHAMALRTGRHPLETKPDVCWQLPIWCEEEAGVTTVTEYSRLGWGEGGEDFHWWCTEDPAAFTHADPLYISYGPELAMLLGDDVYAELKRLCDARLGAIPTLPGIFLPLTVVRTSA